ncbi:hypothetical protein D9758_009871 [Tetrapyrgos nigripes]|uniref:Uncharacterized protein n=1 Tax=Tetrapyrgos nigripes TaxID=182062 RepID=A0A8H5GMY5_9AGAR|nr:hypothetical protein D9758_009871 [Tetrapyrgos nigripes]
MPRLGLDRVLKPIDDNHDIMAACRYHHSFSLNRHPTLKPQPREEYSSRLIAYLYKPSQVSVIEMGSSENFNNSHFKLSKIYPSDSSFHYSYPAP